MVRGSRRTQKQEDTYTLIGARITRYDVRVTAGLNVVLKLADRREATPRAPLYTYVTTLQIQSSCTYPAERVGEQYDLLIVGDPHAADLQLKLEDIHARDTSHTPRYRRYRDVDVPVYEPPPGITVMVGGRMRQTWQIYLPAAPHLVSDMLTALSSGAAPFLSLHEHRVEGKRWIDSLTLQSTDPAQE